MFNRRGMEFKMKRIIFLLFLSVVLTCKKHEDRSKQVASEKVQVSILVKDFKYKYGTEPLISVHRGGVGLVNYPENCLETIKYVNDSISAIFEIDIAKTKDNVLVLMHDNTLERTTTGSNKISEYTYNELLDYNLVDDFGNETSFKIPKFSEVLKWAKNNNVILTIDIKRSVNISDVISLIREEQAENISVIITYDIEQANRAHDLAPDLLLSVSARNMQELDWLLSSKIPTRNMLAFTGTRISSPILYNKLHELEIKTILGTLGNLDKQAETRGDNLYKDWHKMGVDVFATDRPFQAAKALNVLKEN
jgi:glycerophosphoryl diester phosphodiesterase